uniref:Uncharacterized protein n=1 Tax=Plectus sambesii TaxID=2011161 RepID=A0A914WPK4_9BILA
MAFYREHVKQYGADFDRASNDLFQSIDENPLELTKELFEAEMELARKVRTSLHELDLINRKIQRYASLGIPPCSLDPLELTKNYRNTSNLLECLRSRWSCWMSITPMDIEKLYKEIMQLYEDSAIIEFPLEIHMTEKSSKEEMKINKMYQGILQSHQDTTTNRYPNKTDGTQISDAKMIMVDRAPLVRKDDKAKSFAHKKHPTFQIRIRALGDREDQVHGFKATVDFVTAMSSSDDVPKADSEEIVSAGKLSILPVAKSTIHHKYQIDNNGWAVFDTEYDIDEHKALQAQFDDVKLNRAGRCPNVNNRCYLRAKCELRLQLNEQEGQVLSIPMTTLSQPFLVFKNDVATEKGLGEYIWDILRTLDSNDKQEEWDFGINDSLALPTKVSNEPEEEVKNKEGVNWRAIKALLKNYLHVVVPGARPLHEEEINTLQYMLFMPLLIDIKRLPREFRDRAIAKFEEYLFRGYGARTRLQGVERIQYRLLRDSVRDDVAVKRRYFLGPKCISVIDGNVTLLDHSVWQWYYNVIHIIRDKADFLYNKKRNCPKVNNTPVNRNVCPSMMTKLFNESFITICSQEMVEKTFKAILEKDKEKDQETKAIFMRFDENLSSICFSYSPHFSQNLPMNAYRTVEDLKKMEHGVIDLLMLCEVAYKCKYLIALVEKRASFARKDAVLETRAVREQKKVQRRPLEVDVDTGFAPPAFRSVFVLTDVQQGDIITDVQMDREIVFNVLDDDQSSTVTSLSLASTVRSVARQLFRLKL